MHIRWIWFWRKFDPAWKQYMKWNKPSCHNFIKCTGANLGKSATDTLEMINKLREKHELHTGVWMEKSELTETGKGKTGAEQSQECAHY
jgi:hypothetical protein